MSLFSPVDRSSPPGQRSATRIPAEGHFYRAGAEGVRATRSYAVDPAVLNGLPAALRQEILPALMQANSEPARLSYNCTMTADLLAMPIAPPEWRHSGPYLVIALALHALVLVLAPSLLPEKPGVPPAQIMTVTFEQPATLSVPLAPPPPPAATAPRPPSIPDRPRQSPVPRRAVLAVVAKPGTKPASFSVAESAAAADERPAAPASATGNVPVPVPVAAARYDAAYLHNPRPPYPPLSRRLGEEGKVLLRVRVNREGQAVTVDLEKSSNFERLDEAARAVVSRWRFVPARRGDEAIEATVIVPIVFRLDD